MTVELIYDRDCPNIAEARGNLLRAFGLAHVPAVWTEWDLSKPETPAHLRMFGSPAVLVNRRDVAGLEPSGTQPCCRVYRAAAGRYAGAPETGLIVSALQRGIGSAWRRTLLTLPGIGFGLLPKLACPACWPAYASLLSSAGLGFLLSRTYLLPLTLAFLAI